MRPENEDKVQLNLEIKADAKSGSGNNFEYS